MRQILGSLQMKEADRYTIEEKGVPSLVLMERASLAVVEELKKDFDLRKVLVVCGSGNNGGDGMAVARLLHLAGYTTDLFLAGKKESFTKDAQIQWNIAENYGVSVVKNPVFGEYTTIVDAIFGVGLSRPVEGRYRDLLEQIEEAQVDVLAIDIPSGVDGTTGQVLQTALHARKTVTFAYGKTGLYLYPGASYAGEVIVRDIGIYRTWKDALQVLEESDKAWLPERAADGNKGTFGKVLVVAGSRNMSGAAYFSAKAALLSGAGMVRIFTGESNRIILQQQFPEAILTVYDDRKEYIDPEGILEELNCAQQWADTVLIGPGIGTGSLAERMVFFLLGQRSDKPLVIDADGINLIALRPNIGYRMLKEPVRPWILTPHMGEMARLLLCRVSELKKTRLEMFDGFLEQCSGVLVMKDARTLVGDDKGHRYLNLTGNSGMATAGSGDVLAGMITGLLAQGMEPVRASALAVFLHGQAGDYAKVAKGERSVRASDLLDALPAVFDKDRQMQRKNLHGED